MKIITSTQNPIFKKLKDLLDTKGAKKNQLSLAFGSKIVADLMKNQRSLIASTVRSKDHAPLSKSFDEIVLSKSLFNQLDVFGTHYPALVMKNPSVPEWTANFLGQNEIGLFLPLQDPGNLGASLRTAAAFSFTKIILSEESAFPFNPKVIRAASGCHYSMSMCITRDYDFGKIPVHGLDRTGENLETFSHKRPFILALGSEGKGLIEKISYKTLISIPIADEVESLNASIASAIVMYELNKKFR